MLTLEKKWNEKLAFMYICLWANIKWSDYFGLYISYFNKIKQMAFE